MTDNKRVYLLKLWLYVVLLIWRKIDIGYNCIDQLVPHLTVVIYVRGTFILFHVGGHNRATRLLGARYIYYHPTFLLVTSVLQGHLNVGPQHGQGVNWLPRAHTGMGRHWYRL